jgi:hypothetical protein
MNEAFSSARTKPAQLCDRAPGGSEIESHHFNTGKEFEMPNTTTRPTAWEYLTQRFGAGFCIGSEHVPDCAGDTVSPPAARAALREYETLHGIDVEIHAPELDTDACAAFFAQRFGPGPLRIADDYDPAWQGETVSVRGALDALREFRAQAVA